MTISYPVDYTYDEIDGAMVLGYAATADEAYSLLTDGLDESDLPDHMPEIVSRQAGRAATKEEIERLYAAEIEAGYASPVQAGNWWIAEIETWII